MPKCTKFGFAPDSTGKLTALFKSVAEFQKSYFQENKKKESRKKKRKKEHLDLYCFIAGTYFSHFEP